MKTNISLSVRWFTFLPLLGLAAGAGLFACSGEFKAECPEGTVQNGGGDVDEACVAAAGAGGGGGQGGEGGLAGGQGGQGAGGSGQPGECVAGATQCRNDAQETCSEDGRWGAAKACDIQCDAEGSKCVVPVQLAAGNRGTCAALSDGTVRCWGTNLHGGLGLGIADEAHVELKPAVVPGLGNVKSISASSADFCAITNAGAGYCWGDNRYEQVLRDPNGQSPKVLSPAVFPEQGVSDVDAGTSHICVAAGSSLRCRGNQFFGALGNNATQGQLGEFADVVGFNGTPVEVRAGGAHTCTLSSDGGIYCWGKGQSGPLGQGLERNDSAVAVKVKSEASDIEHLVSGDEFSCGLRKDEVVVCWGNNFWGTLGRGHGTDYTTSDVIADNGTPAPVVGLSSVAQIAAVSTHACALKKDGTLWCWGNNETYALGNDCSGPPCVIDETVGRTYSHTPMRVPLDGVKYGFVGIAHSCAILQDDSVSCWGSNQAGQLGNGEVNPVLSPTPVRVLWK